jgi:hypothetical protein
VPNPIVKGSFELRIEAALASARHAAAIKHPGLKGEVREILVRELLRPLLPPTFSFGTGKIIDSHGAESDQIDVVVYDRAVMPPMLFAETALLGLFPIEACVYAIEVKSEATPATWREASENAASLGRLTPLSTVAGVARPDPVIPMLFAFQSNLKSHPDTDAELARWRKHVATVPMNFNPQGTMPVPTVRVVCVAGKGYGVWWPHLPYDWNRAVNQHNEIIYWFIGVANTLYQAVGRPPSNFGHYLG